MATPAHDEPLPPVGYNAREDGGDSSGDPEGQKKLHTLDIACLIINKQIGAGIYTTPATVLLLTQNKVTALFLWIIGGAYSFLSIYIWLEYGLAWPFNGGEFIYVTKIFPRPPLIACCAFAWAFIAFSTSVANGFNFAKFFLEIWIDHPTEWLQKFWACAIIIAICFVHYRLVNIGIKANNFLACYKVVFLAFLIITGFFEICIKGGKGKLLGIHDFGPTQTTVSDTNPQCFTDYDWSEPTKIQGIPIVKPGAATGVVNGVTALLLVFFSYSGWENANYVTSEILGTVAERKKRLKRGALCAVSVTTFLYILFNLFLFFLLDFCTIVNPRFSVAMEYSLEAFNSSNLRDTRRATCICIALSACGNLVGTIFTNIRVKRDIAKYQIIPFWRYFSMSSRYGQTTWDGLGTPTGGIVLHALVSCITIAATPFYNGPAQEGLTFVVSLFTYAHSVLAFILGFGLFFLKRRMNDNQTANADEVDAGSEETFEYKLLRNDIWRYILAVAMILVNGFVIFASFAKSDYPSGEKRRIDTYILPIVVLGMYCIGAIVGYFIMCFAWGFEFKGSLNDGGKYFLNYDKRRWWFEFTNRPNRQYSTDGYFKQLANFFEGRPQQWQLDEDGQPKKDERLLKTTKSRRLKEGEKDSAYLLRTMFSLVDRADPRAIVEYQRNELIPEFDMLRRRRMWVEEHTSDERIANGAPAGAV